MSEIKKDLKKTLEFDPEKVEKLVEDLVTSYQEAKPTVGEIIISLSNLTYLLGASIGGFSEKGPSIEELKQLYYQESGRIDVALMLQGMTMTTWYEDWEQQRLKLDTQDKEGD